MGFLLELGWDLFMWCFDQAENARSPLLGGFFAGLAGAVCGAVVCATSRVLWGGPASAYELLWVEWALVGAAMLGYPAGVVLGVHHVGRRRGYSGTRWFAISGACAGAGMGLGLYLAYRWAEGQYAGLPGWVLPAVVLIPVAFIPSLAALGYGFGPRLGREEREQEPGGSRRSTRPARKATSEAGTAGKRPGALASAEGYGECASCGAVNPADSDSCGECGRPLDVALVSGWRSRSSPPRTALSRSG